MRKYEVTYIIDATLAEEQQTALIERFQRLIGEQGGAQVTVEELAQWAGTIPYEILAGISARVPRIYEQ